MRYGISAPAAALLGVAFMLGVAPASAQVARPQAGNVTLGANVNSGDATLTEVRYRNRGWRGNRYHYSHRRHNRGWGPGLGVGLATGAIIGGAIAAQSQARANAAVEYCMSRFRSYDPRSGTYLGYDGLRHPCP